MKKYLPFFFISLSSILLDQLTKLLVYYTMTRGEEFVLLGDWLKIHYTLNPGMAFGLELDTSYGKLILSVFRILAVFAIAWYLKNLIDKRVHYLFACSVALILGGAIGNVLDSVFYGVFLDDNLYDALGHPLNVPTPWLHGQVIDMIYVDIWSGRLPDWIPLIGGDYYSFWPIFNIADSSIFVGVSTIIAMQRVFFREEQSTAKMLLIESEEPPEVEKETGSSNMEQA